MSHVPCMMRNGRHRNDKYGIVIDWYNVITDQKNLMPGHVSVMYSLDQENISFMNVRDQNKVNIMNKIDWGNVSVMEMTFCVWIS